MNMSRRSLLAASAVLLLPRRASAWTHGLVFTNYVTLPENYGVISGPVSGAQRIANVAGINNAIAAAKATNGGSVVLFGPFTYQINGTIIVTPAASNAGVLLQGTRAVTRIEQYNATGIDTIQYGGAPGASQTIYGGGVDSLWIVSMNDLSTVTPPTGNIGAQLMLTNTFFCTFGNIIIGENNLSINGHTHYAYKGIACDPSSVNFSNIFHDIEIKGFGNTGFDHAGNSSGDVMTNIMIRNGGLGDTPLKSSNGPLLNLNATQGVYDQINLEWSVLADFNNCALKISSASGINFGHLHMEGLQFVEPGGQPKVGIINCFGLGTAKFDSIGMISLQVDPNATSHVSNIALFGFGFNTNFSQVSVGQLIVQGTTLGAGVSFNIATNLTGPPSQSQVDFTGPVMLFPDGSFSGKITGWSSYVGTTTDPGPANALGTIPTNFRGTAIYTVTTSSPGYSAGVYTPTMLDGNDTYQWATASNLTVNLPQTQLDTVLPVTTPVYPGTERTIINKSAANTVAVHNIDTTNILTGTSLAAGQFVRVRFSDVDGKWHAINGGTLP